MINYLVGAPRVFMGEVASISDILTQAGLLFTWVFQQLATVVTTITANPLLMVGFLITLVGLTLLVQLKPSKNGGILEQTTPC